MRRTLPLDYDHNPDRFRTGRAVVHEFGLAGDVHTPIAARLLRETGGRALDMGCGDGVLGRLLLGSALRWVGIDLSLTLLSDAPRPAVLGDAACLPFSFDSFAAVAGLFVLYHLGEPGRAIREAHRVLRSGGLFVAAAPSRYESPELHGFAPPGPARHLRCK